MPSMTSWQPGDLVAEGTQRATQLLGPCLCGRAILTGERVARLADGTSRWIHTGCAQFISPPQRERGR